SRCPWCRCASLTGYQSPPTDSNARLVPVAGLAALDEQHAVSRRLPAAAQIVGLVARLDDSDDRVLEWPRGLRQEAHLGVAVEGFEFGDQFLHGHCASVRCW